MVKTAVAAVFALAFAAMLYYVSFAGFGQQMVPAAPEYNLQPLPPARENIEPPAPAVAQCDDGQQKSCSLTNGCSGTSVCDGGRWSECSTARVCRPGRVAPCPLDSCNFGIRECDECGSGWSECAPAD
ncbi:MAG: hypothetical protein V1822_01205 [Candidatus Micrarchaeota archaeon]